MNVLFGDMQYARKYGKVMLTGWAAQDMEYEALEI